MVTLHFSTAIEVAGQLAHLVDKPLFLVAEMFVMSARQAHPLQRCFVSEIVLLGHPLRESPDASGKI